MNTTKIQTFNVIGISLKTTNENGQATKDIPGLWQKFMGENMISQIPGIVDGNIHCLYTDYEGDHTKPYTVLLGMKVASLENVPQGMTGMSFAGGEYNQYHYEGDLQKGLVYNAWTEIWEKGDDRAFTADFEVYDANRPDPTNASIDIFIAVK